MLNISTGSWVCEICVAERSGKRRRPGSIVPASLLHSPDRMRGINSTKKNNLKRKGFHDDSDEDDQELV